MGCAEPMGIGERGADERADDVHQGRARRRPVAMRGGPITYAA